MRGGGVVATTAGLRRAALLRSPVDRAVLFLEGPELLVGATLAAVKVARRRVQQVRANVVVIAGPGRPIGRSAIGAMGTHGSLEHRPLHLLVEELVGDLGECVVHVALLAHGAELCHVNESAVQDNFGLRIVLSSQDLVGLDLPLGLESG